MRFNRFVFLNRPVLSLETHLGVTASPQAPFPADYVTLPVFGKSPPLRLTASRSRGRACSLLQHQLRRTMHSRHAQAARSPSGRTSLAGRTIGDVSRPGLVRTLRCEVLFQKVRRHRQRVLRIGGRLEAAFVPPANVILMHQPLHSSFAHRDSESLELLVDPRRAVGGLGLLVDLADPLEQRRVAQPFLRPLAALPGREPTVTHLQRRAQHLLRIRVAMLFDKRVPHSDSLAKYAAAFFMISISIFSRAFSARSREISICSGVIGWPFSMVPSLPSACALTQLRIDCSGTPISRPTCLIGSPPRTRRNASSLNSSVYATFGIRFIAHLQRYIIARYRWCQITAGKLTVRSEQFHWSAISPFQTVRLSPTSTCALGQP